ncbi:MAG: hypothetical protein MI862_09565 [Desulfobacterales bacterium]|nr:hypothetical protein [Desulfobacterales bacterium]
MSKRQNGDFYFMASFYPYLFIVVTIFLVAVFFILYKHASNSTYKLGGFPFVFLGMSTGFSGGVAIVYNIDTIKGWNPYGWWFFAIFIVTVLLGLLGGIIYGTINKSP